MIAQKRRRRINERPDRIARLWILCAFWMTALALLIFRLVWIVVIPAANVRGPVTGAGASRWQYDAEHFQLTMLSDGRGQILFRNGEAWSGPSSVHRDGSLTSSEPLLAPELLGHVGRPNIWPDSSKVVPEQGRNGLEETFDSLLAGQRPGELGRLQSANSNKPSHVTASTFVLQPRSGSTVVTTISAAKQRRAQFLLSQFPIHHASIVSISLPSRKIAALASADHKKSDALHAVSPGSVFKLVTAAAALETHIVQSDSVFDCDGRVHLPHVHMRCWTTHGHLSLRDAIAQSCDSVFATLGVRLGRRPMAVVGKRFGLEQTGLDQFRGQSIVPDSEAGILFRRPGSDPGLLANTAIGQEDVKITPLEGALMAATIADGGQYQPAHMISQIKMNKRAWTSPVVSTGTTHRACSRFTAGVIKDAMWNAVHSSKGTLYKFHAFPIYAKSGTAELPNGHVHAWMIGFRAQANRPVEAFAFIVENEPSRTAHKVLYQLAYRWLASVGGDVT